MTEASLLLGGEDVAKQMLSDLNLDLICRSHQVVEGGYQLLRRESCDPLEHPEFQTHGHAVHLWGDDDF